jgi:hypothetical protein
MSELEFVKTFFRGKVTFWAVSSQVMKHGSTNTNLKRSGEVYIGRLPIPHGQKHSVSPNQEFLILEIVHYEYGPTGQTVNQVYYLEVLKRLRERVRRNRPQHFTNNSRILHHDNTPVHTALCVRGFLATKPITVL